MSNAEQTLQEALLLIEQLNDDKQQLRDLYEKSVALVNHLKQENGQLKNQLAVAVETQEEMQRGMEMKQRDWAMEIDRKAREFEALQQRLMVPSETEELRLKMLQELDNTNGLKKKLELLESDVITKQNRCNDLERQVVKLEHRIRHQQDTVCLRA